MREHYVDHKISLSFHVGKPMLQESTSCSSSGLPSDISGEHISVAARVGSLVVASDMQVEKNAGIIINIGSKLGLERIPAVPVYSAAKHGLRGWSHNCHEALRQKGIKVTLINPGIWGECMALGDPVITRDAAASFAPVHNPRHARASRRIRRVAAAFHCNGGCCNIPRCHWPADVLLFVCRGSKYTVWPAL